MKLNSFFLSVFCLISSVRELFGLSSNLKIECASYNSCLIENISSENQNLLKNLTKVSHLTLLNANFNKNFNSDSFIKGFDQIKSLTVHQSNFNENVEFESLIKSIMKYQSNNIKILDVSHNTGISMIRKHIFCFQFDNDDDASAKINSTEINLFTLNLSGNQITKVESAAFQSLSSLTELDLSRNSIQNIDCFTDKMLFNLKILKLNDNQMKTLNGDAFKRLYVLEELYLNGNQLKSISAQHLKPIKNLRVLNVSNNKLQSLETLNPKLKVLDLAENDIYLNETRGLDRLTQLKVLNISLNPIGRIHNETFMRLISLEELRMHSMTALEFKFNTNQSNDSPFKGLTSLKYLDLRFNQLHDEKIMDLQLNQLRKLILLQLDGNLLTKLNLTQLPSSLRYLGLENNDFECRTLHEMMKMLRSNDVKLYFSTSNKEIYMTESQLTLKNTMNSRNRRQIQGIQCFLDQNESGECPEADLTMYFYSWHTRVSSLLCLILALIYIWIIYRNKDLIRKIKNEEDDEENEEAELLEDEDGL